MTTYANMGLEAPDVGDSDYPTKVTSSMSKIDPHDHTTGKGVQIPTGGIADSAVTAAKIADNNVTTAKIPDDAITTAKIIDSNVTTAKIADLNVTTAKIANGAVTQAKRVALGQQISSSSGTFSHNGATITAVTNLSVTITTTGRPVLLSLQAVGNGTQSYLFSDGNTNIYFFRGSTELTHSNFFPADLSNTTIPASMIYLDAVSAGTHTYTVRVSTGASDTIQVRQCILVAFEL